MTYLLDSNVFMSAKQLHYGFDFCPAFWEWLIRMNGAGKVFSIEKVADEIQAGADELSDWAAKLAAGFFQSPDQQTLPALHRCKPMGQPVRVPRREALHPGRH